MKCRVAATPVCEYVLTVDQTYELRNFVLYKKPAARTKL